MSYLIDAVNEYVGGENLGALCSAFPVSIALWIKPTSTATNAADEYIFSSGSSLSNTSNGYRIRRDDPNEEIDVIQTNSVSTTTTTTNGTQYIRSTDWHLIVMVTDDDSSDFTAYAYTTAGAVGGTNASLTGQTNAPTLSGMDSVIIGAQIAATPNFAFQGYVAECAIWSGYALTSDDRTALITTAANALGTTQNAALAAYWPLKDDANDDVGTKHLTASGATLDAEHPTLSAGSSAVTRSPTVGSVSVAGYAPTVTKSSYALKLLCHPSAASATNVAGVVFAAPSGSDITGAKLGEFTGQTFEAGLESGQAVLKVATTAFGGGSLGTSDTPVALVRNSLFTTGLISGTVVSV